MKSVTWKFTKNCTPSQVFFEEFHKSCRTARSSHQRCSIIKCIDRNFAEFTGKHLCQSLFFNKIVGLRPATLLKKRLWNRCFPVNFAKLLRTPFLQMILKQRHWKVYLDGCFSGRIYFGNIPAWLLLKSSSIRFRNFYTYFKFLRISFKFRSKTEF